MEHHHKGVVAPGIDRIVLLQRTKAKSERLPIYFMNQNAQDLMMQHHQMSMKVSLKNLVLKEILLFLTNSDVRY